MSLRILGGQGKGFSLAVPKGFTTRPTSVLLRRKLFDRRQNLEGYSFVDLFAGSGAVGIEALSRGADKVVLNDSLRSAWQTLKQNRDAYLNAFSVAPETIAVSNQDAVTWLRREFSYQVKDGERSILYVDPPYEDHALYFKVLEELRAQAFPGELWLESDRLKGPELAALSGSFQAAMKSVTHGDHFVLIGKLL